MHEQTAVAVREAETVLERKEKIETAIRVGVADLSALIVSRVETERTFRHLEAAASIGEPAPGLAAARKAASDAQAALDQASLRLGGLRAALGAQGIPMVQAHAALTSVLPSYENGIIEAFRGEWGEACRQFSVLLGRRTQIEKLIRRELELPAPAGVPAALGPVAVPYVKVSELEKGIERVGGMRTAAEGRRKMANYPGMTYPAFDPHAIYRVTTLRGAVGAPFGALVVEASFDAGTLDLLVAVRDVDLHQAIEHEDGVLAAETASKAITAARAAEHTASSEARLYATNDENLKKSVRLPDEEYHPTQADLDRAAERQRAIDAREPLTTTRGY